ncbi:MAG: hypothetical protein IIC84_04235 [Chloroflexi bacterium]|nr:hypothetical protein [Chloroflexota bacterium]
MNTKTFMMLLIGVLVIGGVLGGAVIAATTLGGSDAPEPAQAVLAVPASSSLGQQSQQQVSQQQTEQASQPSNPQISPDVGSQLFNGGSNLIGTVEKIDGDMLTISTSDGSILAMVGDDATIQLFAEVTPENLAIGTQVTVNGERGEDGLLVASSIVVIPEGEDGFFGGGGFGGRRGPGTGQLDQEQLDQLRQQFQGQFGGGGGNQQFQGQFTQGAGGGQGFGGRGDLTGTVESIVDGIITIETPRGPLQATITDDTTIQRFSQGTLSDLPVGAQVRVTGQQGEDGTFEATSVFMLPEDGFGVGGFGGGFFGGQDGSGRPRFPGGFQSSGSDTASP